MGIKAAFQKITEKKSYKQKKKEIGNHGNNGAQ